MSNLPDSGETARSVIRQVETQLQTLDPSAFSPSAFKTLEAKIGEYVNELVDESVKVSRRHQADTVSAAHIERASEYLVANTSRRIYRHMGTAGGVLLGTAISNILAMSSVGQYTGGGAILSTTLGIIGAFMIALPMAKD
uniref:Uncharacterized protein n=1 Tax=Candidatus Kentrum sp. LPFa TaxID=2126335 RepID=A0A450WHC2_9GAMM|nr:MAG: hypothetical protein BECKLPF1236B_GA0070989_109512 [Candidatus Kentron sp. LPFa]